MKIGLIQAFNAKMDVQKRYPPLGLAYIASYLENYGGYEDVFYRNDVDSIISKKPDIVAISSVSQNFNGAVEIAKEIKQVLDIPVIIGGPHITALPHTLQNCFDFGVIGEGEQTMLELIVSLENGDYANIKNIDGLVFRENDKLVITKKREAITPLDKIPMPKRDLFNNEWDYSFNENISIMTSRGCPYKCRFCSSTKNWVSYRYHSAEYVVDEIKYLIDEYNPKVINFYDDLFVANRKRLEEIVNLICEEKINDTLQFICSVRADLLDDELCELLKRMNVVGVGFGAESGSDKVLSYLKKETTTSAQNQKAIDLCNKHGINVACSFIIGAPCETKEDIFNTYNFIRKNKTKMSGADIYPLTAHPGTEIWHLAFKQNKVNESMDWNLLNQDYEHFEINEYIFLNEHNMSKTEFYEYFMILQDLHQSIEEHNNFEYTLALKNELNKLVQLKDNHIHNLESLLNSNNEQIEELNKSVQNKDIHIHNLESLLNSNNEQIEVLNKSVQNKESHIRNLESLLNSNNEQIEELNKSVQNKDIHIHNLESAIAENNIKLNDIYSSTTWQMLAKYQKLLDVLLPHTTKRRHVYDLGIISMRIIVNDGFSAFLYKLKERVRGSAIDASKIALIQTNLNTPHVPLPLTNNLCGKFTFPTNNLNEIRVLTATYQRRNSDLELHIINSEGQIIRKSSIRSHRIQDNEYTSFKFKPIKDSKEQTFIFKLVSKGEPSAAVWHNESVTVPELALIYDDAPLNGSIGFQAFADIGIKSRYDLWILKNEPTQAKLEQYKEEIQNFEYQPKISIVTPVYNPDVAWIEAAIESVINQVYGNWELCLADASTKDDVKKCLEAYAKKDCRIKVKFVLENKGISGNSNEALSLATGEYIGLLDHDDELSPNALYEVVKHLQTNRDADMIYSDEDKIDLDGNRSDPFFKPDWSPDMFLSCMYTCHFGVYNKKIIDEIGGFREGYDGSQDYDLVLRFIDKTNRIDHIPKISYHWRTTPHSTATNTDAKSYCSIAGKKAINDFIIRNDVKGVVLDGIWPTSYRLKRDLIKTPLVSVIIPTKDHMDVLKRCVDSIFKFTKYPNYEIVIVDNDSVDKKTLDYFKDLSEINNVKILEYKKDFNFSAINNFAVQNSNGEVILFLNNDTEIIAEGWLTAMLEHVQRSEVGAVGCKLLYPNNTIQHAGVILGITGTPGEKGVAGHSHKHFPSTDHGYVGRVNVVHNQSAVTAACMMLRKDVFEEVGGFDENLAIAFNDVDLCLKIREKGYLIVYTPYAELYHHESLSRGHENTPEKQRRFSKEVRYIRDKWKETIDGGDPYYNPNLTLEREDFSIKV